MEHITYHTLDGATIAGTLFTPEKAVPSPCVIICHGAFESREKFFPFGRHLATNGLCALIPDMPGHGQSSGERHAIDIPAWIEAISAAIDKTAALSNVNTDAIALFGFSSGGTAVLETALIEDRVKAIVTLDATVRNYMGFWDTLFFKFLVGLGAMKLRLTGRQWRPNLTSVLKKAIVAHDPDINRQILSDPQLIDAYSAMPLPAAGPCAFVDTVHKVSAIKTPTLIMHGKEDRIDNVETAYLLYERLACEKSLEIIPESGHCGHLDINRERIMELTTRWMKAHLT